MRERGREGWRKSRRGERDSEGREREKKSERKSVLDWGGVFKS